MIREKAILSPTRRRLKSTGRYPSKWNDEVNLRFFDRQDPLRTESKDRDRSASNSKGRSSGMMKSTTKPPRSGSGKKNHPDYENVPDYYNVDIPKKVVPLSLTASPGIRSLSVSTGSTSILSSLSSISSLSSSSVRSPNLRTLKPNDEIEICKLFANGTCIRGALCSYRHEPRGIGATNGSNGK